MISQQDVLINIHFMLMDAADIALRKAIDMVENQPNASVKICGKVKMHHNRMMQNAKALMHNYEEAYMTKHAEAFSNDASRNDDLRKSANYMLRLACLISDRTYHDHKLDDEIEDFVKKMESSGLFEDKLIETFRLK